MIMPLVIKKETVVKHLGVSRCPCCGGEAQCSQVTSLFDIPGDVKERIRCKVCGLTLEDEYGKAKEKWNMRANNITELKSEDDATKCQMCIHGLVCHELNEIACDKFSPDDIAQLKMALDSIVKPVVDAGAKAVIAFFNALSRKNEDKE